MADIISKTQAAKPPVAFCASAERPPAAPAPHTDATSPDLVQLVELFFFAYRDFTGEADAVLAEFDLGRAHHRVLHFVNRKPGLRVADLLDLLRVTKQSLARVLKTLVDEGWIEQLFGANDRRERRLYLTMRGAALADRLAQLQMRRIADAVALSGDTTGHSVHNFMRAMIRHQADRTAPDATPAHPDVQNENAE